MATQLQRDYYITFLASEAGRRVKADLTEKAINRFRDGKPMTPDEARAQCVLDEFILQIDESCGLAGPDAKMRMLEYQAIVSADMLEHEPEEQEKEDLHKI